VISAFFFLLGIFVMMESRNLSLGDGHAPGPGFVPFFLGVSMAGLSLLSFIAPDTGIPGDAFWNDWRKGRNILLVFASLVLYLGFLKLLGFYVATFFLLVGLMKLSGEEGYKRCVVCSLFTIVVIYWVFYKLFIIPFPPGILSLTGVIK
jgi:hypothetical protein